MIKQLVTIYDSTIALRMQAIWSASLSVMPVFSPRALAQILQIVFMFHNLYAMGIVIMCWCYSHLDQSTMVILIHVLIESLYEVAHVPCYRPVLC